MMQLSKYLISFLIIIILYLSGKYYFLHKQYTESLDTIKTIQVELALESANNETLRQMILVQNNKIDAFEYTSQKYQSQINDLNNEIMEYNQKEETHTKEKMENKNADAEEAMKWLLEKSSSLL